MVQYLQERSRRAKWCATTAPGRLMLMKDRRQHAHGECRMCCRVHGARSLLRPILRHYKHNGKLRCQSERKRGLWLYLAIKQQQQNAKTHHTTRKQQKHTHTNIQHPTETASKKLQASCSCQLCALLIGHAGVYSRLGLYTASKVTNLPFAVDSSIVSCTLCFVHSAFRFNTLWLWL